MLFNSSSRNTVQSGNVAFFTDNSDNLTLETFPALVFTHTSNPNENIKTSLYALPAFKCDASMDGHSTRPFLKRALLCGCACHSFSPRVQRFSSISENISILHYDDLQFGAQRLIKNERVKESKTELIQDKPSNQQTQ
ncbi:hypothetical protein RRG08_032687 [Elysia crispata]|uniref:Uncharacterized protein n=1 Tax=Elysia crispata TaxID=231223 RepID=A0AAE0Y038_9GAST|nr:hypothetical protein RRG08_032687 [Elysia crispata]